MASLSTPSISEQIEALFDDDRWFDAVEKYEEHKKLIDETLASEKVSKIKQASGELKHLMQELKSTEGWELKSLASDVDDVWYRYEEDKQTHSFRTEGFVKAPLFNLISLIYEFDLFPSWCKCGVICCCCCWILLWIYLPGTSSIVVFCHFVLNGSDYDFDQFFSSL